MRANQVQIQNLNVDTQKQSFYFICQAYAKLRHFSDCFIFFLDGIGQKASKDHSNKLKYKDILIIIKSLKLIKLKNSLSATTMYITGGKNLNEGQLELETLLNEDETKKYKIVVAALSERTASR